MPHRHVNFFVELAGKIGPAIIAATLVGCLLAEKFQLVHGVMIGIGVVLTGGHHWWTEHRHPPTD